MTDSTDATVQWPDGHVLLRVLDRPLPVASRGDGVWIYDDAGNAWLDGSSGAFVTSVGHGNREVVASIADALGRVAYVNGTQFTNRPTEELAARLVAYAPAGLDKAFFLASGSEAVEASIKFCRQLWFDRGQPQRDTIIARTPSYHGNTLYALSASGRPHYKTVYGPLLSDVATVSSPYAYRTTAPSWDEAAAWYADELDAKIRAVGVDRVAAFIAEPIIGSSAGAALPPDGYFAALREVCDRYGVLMIADEVLVGVGRTGTFFACESQGFSPDLLVMGKGIGGGYAALSAVLVKSTHVEEMRASSGKFMHAQTYMQAPMMTAAGVAVLDYMEQHGVIAHAADVGAHLQDALRARVARRNGVGNVSGRGLLAGVEFVADTETRAPFDRSRRVAEAVTRAAFDRGLVVWPNVGQVDGTRGDLVMIAPPLTITHDEVDTLVARLGAAIDDVMSVR
jgi:adenosylmethionine-8-amino-7-oxononanoate aminotransferase